MNTDNRGRFFRPQRQGVAHFGSECTRDIAYIEAPHVQGLQMRLDLHVRTQLALDFGFQFRCDRMPCS